MSAEEIIAACKTIMEYCEQYRHCMHCPFHTSPTKPCMFKTDPPSDWQTNLPFYLLKNGVVHEEE